MDERERVARLCEVRRLVRDGETTEQAARALLDDLCSAMVDVLRKAPR